KTIDRVSGHISIEVHVPIAKSCGILRRPAPYLRIVVSCAKLRELRIFVVNAARITEGLESRIAIQGDEAELVIVYALRYCSGVYIDYQAHAAEMIGQKTVELAIFHHIVGHIATSAVYKTTD